MDNLLIRPATTEDQTAVVELFQSFMNEVASQHPHVDFSPYITNALQVELTKLDSYYIQNVQNEFLIAELEARVIGTVGFEEKSAHTAEIRRLMVSKKHRRNGIATELMSRAESKCIELGYKEIVLETSEFQPASIALYERFEYQQELALVSVTKAHKGVSDIKRFKFRKSINLKDR